MMGIVQGIIDFLQSLFMSSSPEVQKRLQLKRMAVDLRNEDQPLFKNDMVQPTFAAAVYELYRHSKPLDNLFSETVGNKDVRCRDRYLEALFITGYSAADQQLLETLSYENRKKAVFEHSDDASHVFESQRHSFEHLLSELNSASFKKIDVVVADMYQFVDLCHFNFVSILQLFDHSFNGLDSSYKPAFQAVPPQVMEQGLLDLYYLTANLHITESLGNLIHALVQLHNGGKADATKQAEMVNHVKVLFSIIKNILKKDTLFKLISLAKNDPAVKPETAVYKNSVRQLFATKLKEYFNVDEQRIKLELKNSTTASEIQDLFGEHPLVAIQGYDEQTNNELQANSPVSFMHIIPLQIIKTFLSIYMSDPIKALLNDIVIEGFFENPAYKTDFSAAVFGSVEASAEIERFEHSLDHGQPNDVHVLRSYLTDSHGDPDFMKKLVTGVNAINTQANALINSLTSTLFTLSKVVSDILVDAKKPSSEIISNLKVLLLSSRNRDSTDLLERQFPNWELFFDIMKNYAIINKGEAKK